MNFNGNPSADLGLEYHSFSEIEREGKLITRYVLSTPVDSNQEAEISKYDNLKLVRNGCQHRYAPEIKYDVLYVSEVSDPEEDREESNPTAEYLRANEDIDDSDLMSKLDEEISKPEVDEIKAISKYAAITSAMSSVNDLIVLFKSLSSQFVEDQALFEDLIGENEVILGKLSSLINTPETADNMAKGISEGEVLANKEPSATEDLSYSDDSQEEADGGYEDGEEVDWDEDPRFTELKNLIIEKVKNSQIMSEDGKESFLDEIQYESLAEFIGFYSEDGPDPEETLSSREKMEEVATSYVSYLEDPENGFCD